MRPTDADALMPLFIKKAYGMKDRHGVKPGENWLLNYDDIKDVIDNAPPVEPQKIVTIPPELIEKLASCVVDIVGNIDWEKAIEAYKASRQDEWIQVGERLPEGKSEDMIVKWVKDLTSIVDRHNDALIKLLDLTEKLEKRMDALESKREK